MRTVRDDVLGTPFSHSRWGMRRPYLSLSESKDVETRFQVNTIAMAANAVNTGTSAGRLYIDEDGGEPGRAESRTYRLRCPRRY